MPAKSKAQQRLMAMAEHATPEQLKKAGPEVRGVASSMSHKQLHDFASGSEKGKPEHVHKKHEGRHGGGRGGRELKGRGE